MRSPSNETCSAQLASGIGRRRALEGDKGSDAVERCPADGNARDQLARRQIGRIGIGEQVANRLHALALRTLQQDLCVERNQERRPTTARIRLGQGSADGPHVADLRIGNAEGAIADDRKWLQAGATSRSGRAAPARRSRSHARRPQCRERMRYRRDRSMRSGLISRSFIIGISVWPPARPLRLPRRSSKPRTRSDEAADFEVVEIVRSDTSSYSSRPHEATLLDGR